MEATVVAQRVARRCMRAASWALIRQTLEVRLEGTRHIPARGPVLLACRHYHHLYDGCVLVAALPRPLSVLVALDWVAGRWTRLAMERLCALAGWPVVLRADRLETARDGSLSGGYRPVDGLRYLRQAVRATTLLLRSGEALAIFPEAYPTIDPSYTPKESDDAFLPFHAGFVRLVEIAQRDHQTGVAIIPVGLSYIRQPLAARPWRVTLRCGAPLYLRPDGDRDALLRTVEEQVHRLSAPPVA